jgi:hypothetical protein
MRGQIDQPPARRYVFIMTVRSPREENGPDGYPRDNTAFREAAQKVVQARKEDAEQARRFLEKLSSSLRGQDGREP